MSKKILAISTAVVALAAFALAPAMASATSPVLTHNGVALVKGENVVGASDQDQKAEFVSGFATVRCTHYFLTGDIHVNSGTEITTNIHKASFHNVDAEGRTIDCESTIGAVKVTTSASWCIKANTETGPDKGIVEPHLCTGAGGEFTFTLDFTNVPFIGTVECSYKRTTNVNGTYNTNIDPATLELTGEPAFTKEAGGVNSGSCSAEGKLKKLNVNLYTDTTSGTGTAGESGYLLTDPLTIS